MMCPMRRRQLILLALLLLCTVSFSVSAAEEKTRGEYLTIRLMTLGQGDPVYLWYGHVGLIVDDELTDRSYMFDFGVFDFMKDHFYRNFAFGRLYYQVIASSAESRIRQAVSSGRNVSMITLDLPPENRLRLFEALVDHVQPENSTYLYHHYYNNCSTKIRDILDLGTDGQLKEWAQAIPSAYSYREHIRRYSGNHLFIDFVLNFLQSGVIDGETTLWDEMFLPDRMERALLQFSFTDGAGDSSLIATDHEILAQVAARPPVPDTWSPKWPSALIVSLAAGLLILLLKVVYERRRSKAALRILGAFQAAYGLFGGVLGSILFFMMFFSDHDVTYGNWNIMLLNPLMLVIGVLGMMMLFSKRPERHLRLMDLFWTVAALLAAALLLLFAFSIIGQRNQLSIAMIAPLHICFGISRYIGKITGRKETRP